MRKRIAVVPFILILLTLVCAVAYGDPQKPLVPRRPANKHGAKLPAGTQVVSVIVKFQEGTHLRLRGQHLVSLPRDAREDAQLAALGLTGADVDRDARAMQALIASSRQVRGLERLFSIDEDVLAARRANGEEKSGRELADLDLYYRAPVTAKATQADVDSLVDDLNALRSVEIAYADPPGSVPWGDIGVPTDDYQWKQGYLNAAPTGINAPYAWLWTGGRGAGPNGPLVSVIDVEGAWNTSHEDFPNLFHQGGTQVNNATMFNHGTSVLGVIGAPDNGYGITGIVSGARFGYESVGDADATQTAPAIVNAAIAAGVGGVVIVEVHHLGPATNTPCNSCSTTQCNYVPEEWFQDRYDAISDATAGGAIVVEAAGNGGSSLDDSIYQGSFNRMVRDSGAILVGAGTSTDHSPMCTTNYGSRLDVQGWGENIFTLGFNPPNSGYWWAGGAPFADTNQAYTALFGGTSGATPIVAGAAASLLGISVANGQAVGYRTSKDIRDILATTGTPQSGTPWIGPLPDLARAVPRLFDTRPIASFTVTCTGLVCDADATASFDDFGTLTYDWNWDDNSTSSGGPTTSHTYGALSTYTVTLTVTDSVGQTGTATQSVSLHTAATTPGSFTATAATTTSVSLTWTASTSSYGIAYYSIQRRSSQSGAWGAPQTTTATSFTDSGLTAATTYQYRIKAVDGLGSPSAYALDYATTVLFGADLVRYTTVIAGAHVRDLRDAADAWRHFAGATDVYPVNPIATGAIKAANFITNTGSDPLAGVVTALNEARVAMGLSSFAYSGVPTPASGGIVYLEHVQQLRDVMK